MLLTISLFQPWQIASSQDTSRIVCISAATARLVLIDLKAYDRLQVKHALSLEQLTLKGKIIESLNFQIEMYKGKVENKEIIIVLQDQEIRDQHKDKQQLNKQLKRSKKSKLWVGGGGLIIGLILGVLLTN